MPKWTKEQMDAIYESGKNIIVSAGAGSGKTAVLTERVVEKLKTGIKINELLILTFTNAAASEMKDRIRKKINENDSIKDNLDYLESSYITTFDSFSLSLVKKYHYLLGLSKNIGIVDNSVIAVKKEEVLDEVFNYFYEVKDKNFLKMIDDFCVKNDTGLKNDIRNIINVLNNYPDLDDYLDSYISVYFSDNKLNEYINKYMKILYNVIEEINTNLYYMESECNSVSAEYYSMCEIALERLIKSKSYEDIKNNTNVILPRRPKGSDEVKIYKDNITKCINKLKDYTIYDSASSIYQSIKSTKGYVESIINIVRLYNKKLKEYKDEYAIYEFIDIELMCIKLLKDNKDILDEIKSNYKEICVDEYQDTNDIQEAFINLIQNNNLYMVGDIKQSIYGFRNANPSIFKNKYDNYKNNFGGMKIDLIKNFRSRSNVLSGINTIFDVVMDNEIGGADYKNGHEMVFGNSTYTDNINELQSYETDIISYNNTLDKFNNEEVEAFIIADDIKNKIKSEYKVIDKESGVLRNISYSDFCIIMDRGSSFGLYKKIFEYLGIPLVIYEDKTLNQDNELLIISNIINLIIKIYDNEFDKSFKYSFMSVLRSYLFNYDDNRIFNIIKNNDYKNNELYLLCLNISKDLQMLSNSLLVLRIIKDFKIYEMSITTGGVDNVIKICDNIVNISNNLSLMGYSVKDFRDYLDKIANSKYEIKYKEDVNNTNGVKIMNVHKSKGLEFPVCYFSGLYKKFNDSDIKNKFLVSKDLGIITPYFKEGVLETVLKDIYKYEYKINDISEKIRLFYVALTRSKEKIILVCPYRDIDNYNMDKRKYQSFLDILESAKNKFKDNTYEVNLNKLNISKDYLFNKINFNNDNMNNEYGKINRNVNVINYEFEEDKKASKVISKLLSKDDNKKLEYGTNIHEMLRMSDFLNSGNSIINNICKILNINSECKLYKEHEFIYYKDNIKYHGIIDLIIVSDKEVKIVDYKLKDTTDDNYKKQVKIYYDYLESLGFKNIKMYLYSIILNELKEINNS